MRRRFAAVLLAVAFAMQAVPAARLASAQSRSGLIIGRAPDEGATFSAERFAALARRSETTRRTSPQGEDSVEWSGPLLWDVLVADQAVDPEKHADHVRMTVLIAGADGYTVRIALAEIAPDFAGKAVLLADRMNGAPLPGGALRLIVPNEKRAGRSVRDPVRITVEHEKATP